MVSRITLAVLFCLVQTSTAFSEEYRLSPDERSSLYPDQAMYNLDKFSIKQSFTNTVLPFYSMQVSPINTNGIDVFGTQAIKFKDSKTNQDFMFWATTLFISDIIYILLCDAFMFFVAGMDFNQTLYFGNIPIPAYIQYLVLPIIGISALNALIIWLVHNQLEQTYNSTFNIYSVAF